MLIGSRNQLPTFQTGAQSPETAGTEKARGLERTVLPTGRLGPPTAGAGLGDGGIKTRGKKVRAKAARTVVCHAAFHPGRHT